MAGGLVCHQTRRDNAPERTKKHGKLRALGDRAIVDVSAQGRAGTQSCQPSSGDDGRPSVCQCSR